MASLDAPELKADLASLRQELTSSSPDLAKASQLVKSLGAATTKIGDSAGSEPDARSECNRLWVPQVPAARTT